MRQNGISNTAVELILKSLRKSSKDQYACYLKRFFLFVKNKPLTSCTEMDLINFLEQLYLSGLGYSACNTARSAVSTLLDLVCQNPVGKNSLVCRMLKGIFEDRPSLP